MNITRNKMYLFDTTMFINVKTRWNKILKLKSEI